MRRESDPDGSDDGRRVRQRPAPSQAAGGASGISNKRERPPRSTGSSNAGRTRIASTPQELEELLGDAGEDDRGLRRTLSGSFSELLSDSDREELTRKVDTYMNSQSVFCGQKGRSTKGLHFRVCRAHAWSEVDQLFARGIFLEEKPPPQLTPHLSCNRCALKNNKATEAVEAVEAAAEAA